MASKLTHKACYNYFSVQPRNPRWSWSAQSADGSRVAVTLWQDRFTNKGRTYEATGHSRGDRWVGSLGHVEMVRNLAHARDRCDGTVEVIIAIPVDRTASPRAIKECFPQPKLRMRVAELDEVSGEFILERIE